LSLARLTSLTAFGQIAAQIADQNSLRDLAIVEVAREFPVWIENGDPGVLEISWRAGFSIPAR
jgi:hypothetical protein